MTVATYTYPMVPAHSIPAVRHRLSHRGFVVLAVSVLAVLVIAITAVVVRQSPTVQPCHFSCGPDVGPRLFSPTAYTSSSFGYRVEYDSSEVSVVNQDATGVELAVPSQKENAVVFTADRGADANGSLEQAVSNLNTDVLQDLQAIGPVPGAEIGLVVGVGEAYRATFVPPDGGRSYPVAVVVMAASQGDLTITAVAVGQQELSSIDLAPFGLPAGGLLDSIVTDTVWPSAP